MSVPNAGTTMKASYIPRRGDIIWTNLDPRIGHEQSGNRPVLVISDDSMSQSTTMVIICPITSQIKGHPYEVPLKGTKTQGVILTPQVRSIDYIQRGARLAEKAPLEIVKDAAEKVGLIIGAQQ